MRFLCIYFYICILCGVSFSIFQVKSLGISRPSRERSRDGLETIFQVMSLKKAYSICKGSSIGVPETLFLGLASRTATGMSFGVRYAFDSGECTGPGNCAKDYDKPPGSKH